ncbi:transcriptional regulator, TraR/DksA family [Amphibacillus marinus]|uniref:Transcriptional regulator, TraR/DksA family n=1 Tax=Amphibacillus marinus TaxID=872970 RepID=A0A1H8HG48_9BACI|nr:TraR/DksA C4-type zinc finger protein [Amphibacillus marinus]SEN55212.1 transcriptional regulator, TraR/DksA family [Amphibacillus marinus]
MLAKEQLTEIKRELTERKRELVKQINLEMELTRNGEYSTELSDYDNHPGDNGSDLYEREKEMALTEHERVELAAIEHSLTRMNNGKYGTCVTCGSTINPERLEAVPTTQFCIEHANQQVNKTEFSPSMGGLENDDTDSWATLESYGTSETASDLLGDHDSYNDMTENNDLNYVDDVDQFSNKFNKK